ncbi:hypothetical protein DFH07DRAFT_776020 [Mycena maculata]|uniref:Uncharacterized protein n=1 Tax=Mycena maculata TaxID=230809 RepID=A0AAD7N688_9AGAR|nr:hypothetical protein DFH07DRAFT_776020 [Mycena maculata]
MAGLHVEGVINSPLPLVLMPPRMVTWDVATQLVPVFDARTVQVMKVFFWGAWKEFGGLLRLAVLVFLYLFAPHHEFVRCQKRQYSGAASKTRHNHPTLRDLVKHDQQQRHVVHALKEGLTGLQGIQIAEDGSLGGGNEGTVEGCCVCRREQAGPEGGWGD